MTLEPHIILNQPQGDARHIIIETCEAVCSQEIDLVIRDGIIEHVEFCGGCSGNGQGLSALLRGMKVEDAISRLRGIQCGYRRTSCPDQLAQGLEKSRHEN